MATLEELVVSLVAETSQLRAGLDSATRATKDAAGKMDKALEEFSKNSSKNIGFFEQSMATMTGFLAADAVKAVLGFAKDGLQFMTAELGKGYDAAIKEEDALKRLANSLALSGQYSESAMVSLSKFTGRMEDLTGIGDDVVASNLAMLSSLTRLDSEGLQRAQKAAIDMSVALGIDLESATRLVGKGIEGNVDAFKRYGIEITAGSSKAENLANVLGKLEGRFNGAAEGAAKTFGGAVLNLSNAWGNFTESLATAVTKNPVVLAMLNALVGVMRELTGSADESSVMLRQGVADAFLFVARSIGVMAQTADYVFRTMMMSIQGLVLGLNAVAGSFAWISDKIGLIDDDDPFARLKDTANALDDTMNKESSFGKLADVMASVSAAGEQAFSKIGQGSEAVTSSLSNQKDTAAELTGVYQGLASAFAQGLADQANALDSHYAYERDLRAINLETEMAQLVQHGANKWALLEEDFAIRNEMLAAQQDKEWTDLEAGLAANKASEETANAARTALAQKHYLDKSKLNAQEIKSDADKQAAMTAGYMTFLDGISSLSQSSNKTLAGIGKAAAITKTTIDAYVAIQNALANVPFPANIAAAAGIGAMAFANVAKVAGVGLNQGGTISGGGANVDTVAASLTKGETVVTRDLTGKLEDFLNGQGGGGSQNITIELTMRDSLVEFIEAKILERQASNISLLTAAT